MKGREQRKGEKERERRGRECWKCYCCCECCGGGVSKNLSEALRHARLKKGDCIAREEKEVLEEVMRGRVTHD